MFTRKRGRDIVKVITEAVEVEESADVATGKGCVASPQMQSTIESVARLREHERDDAFGRAVTAAASEMAAEVQTLEEQLELAEVRMASLDSRLDAADKTTKELRTLLFQISDMAGQDKAEVIKHIEDVELRGFWQSLWAAILIPVGIFLTIVLHVCNLGCPT